MNKRLNSLESTRTCRKNPGLQATQRLPLFDSPRPERSCGCEGDGSKLTPKYAARWSYQRVRRGV